MLELKSFFARRSKEKRGLPPNQDSVNSAVNSLWPDRPVRTLPPALRPQDGSGVRTATTDSWPRVVVLDGVYYIQFTRDRIVPFLQNGEPLRNLGSGWNFHSLFTGFAPVLLFELEHDNGDRATWFFDSVPKFLGHSVEGLAPHDRYALACKTGALLRPLLSSFLGLGPAIGNPAATRFFSISETARLQLSIACSNFVVPAPEYLLLSDFPETLITLPRGEGAPAEIISRDTVAAALMQDFQKRLLKALTDGHLSWPSMVDGNPVPVSASLCFNHFSYAYRVQEPQSGLVYFVIASEHHARLLGLYIPAEGLVISADSFSRQSVMTILPAINTIFLSNICQYGDTLLPGIERPGPKRVIASLRESHLGHQLWNELSGLEAVVLSVPQGDRPLVTTFGGPASECFGPLEQLFPEYSGRIRNELKSERSIIEYANANDMVLARFTRLRVSASLRGRIIHYLQTTDAFQDAVKSRKARPGPAILIGLRVENRTVIELADFVGRLVRHIAEIAPGCTIVLDGQNRRDDEQPAKPLPGSSPAQSPLEREAEICKAVIASAVGYDIAVVTTTGEPMASSIGWTEAADCFIAIWGAGLAKYRWICNKPGLILSSNYHLLNPAEMSIYHTPQTMETPTPVVYADPACVADDPEAAQLIPVDGPRHVSFHVNEALFFPQVTAFLDEFLKRDGVL